MTYMMIAKKLYNIEPAGAYYYSLKDESYQADAKKVVKKEIEEQDWSEEAELVRMLNERRLRGFTFTKRLTEMDDDEKHIVSLKTQMSYELIEECLKEIYEYFYTHVTQGEIDLSPTDNACLYCDYRQFVDSMEKEENLHPFLVRISVLKSERKKHELRY